MTGQPDFATIRISFVPDGHLVELKTLKKLVIRRKARERRAPESS